MKKKVKTRLKERKKNDLFSIKYDDDDNEVYENEKIAFMICFINSSPF